MTLWITLNNQTLSFHFCRDYIYMLNATQTPTEDGRLRYIERLRWASTDVKRRACMDKQKQDVSICVSTNNQQPLFLPGPHLFYQKGRNLVYRLRSPSLADFEPLGKYYLIAMGRSSVKWANFKHVEVPYSPGPVAIKNWCCLRLDALIGAALRTQNCFNNGHFTGQCRFAPLFSSDGKQHLERQQEVFWAAQSFFLLAIVHPDGNRTILSRSLAGCWFRPSGPKSASSKATGKYCSIAIRMYDCE